MNRSDVIDMTDIPPPQGNVLSAPFSDPQPTVLPDRLPSSPRTSQPRRWRALPWRHPTPASQVNLAGSIRRLAVLIMVGVLLALAPRTAGGGPHLSLALRACQGRGCPELPWLGSTKFPMGNLGASRGCSRKCLRGSMLKESILRVLLWGGYGPTAIAREFRSVSRGNHPSHPSGTSNPNPQNPYA